MLGLLAGNNLKTVVQILHDLLLPHFEGSFTSYSLTSHKTSVSLYWTTNHSYTMTQNTEFLGSPKKAIKYHYQ